MKKILLIEDDEQLSRSVSEALRKEGYACTTVFDGRLAERAFILDDYDLVLLDLNLPGENGFSLCQQFRKKNPAVPVVILTAFGDIDSKMEAYDLGAEDYLVKPVHIMELLAKVRIQLKRSAHLPEDGEIISIVDLEINVPKKLVSRAGQVIELTPKEFNLLLCLARQPKRIASKDELAMKVWDESYGVSHNTVEVYISFLRNKVDKNFEPKLIKTKIGFGYYLDDSKA
jgi:two-component system copper resistance phosphate regulon response regulator CusR